LAECLKAKYLISSNSAVSNPSGKNHVYFYHLNEFDISAPQCPTHYSPADGGHVLDILVYKNIRMLGVILSHALDSDHLPILFHILIHIKIRNLLKPIEKLTDWDRFERLTSELNRN
jgi:hypothetical protein